MRDFSRERDVVQNGDLFFKTRQLLCEIETFQNVEFKL